MIKKHIAGFKIAFSMMTILPFFKLHEFKEGCNGYAVAYYPMVGLFLGAVVCGVYALLHGFLPENFLRVLLFALFVMLYGGLHLDGLVDTIDGLFSSKERALEVMKEPTVGAMGAVFGFLFLTVKISAFLSLESLYLFLLVPMLSRFGAVVAIYAYDYIRPSGMGAMAKKEFSAPLFVYSTVLIFTVIATLNMWFFVLFTVVVVKTFGVSTCLKNRFGGLSGDMYGFIIEVDELTLLIALVIWGSMT